MARRLSFGEPNGAAEVALMVVDMQYFDAHRDWGEGKTAKDLGVHEYFNEYFEQIDEITPVIAGLIDSFRRKSMEVIHIRVAELTEDSRDVGYKQLVRGLVVPSVSKEAEFLPTLEPAANEIVISKSSSGVFAVTSLDRILRNLGIKTLVFVGTSTGGCVQSGIFDATDLGYRVIVVEDACADSTRASHRDCVAKAAMQMTEVVTSSELHDVLRTCPDVDPLKRSGVERGRAYQLAQPYLPNQQDGAKIEPYSAIFGPAVRLTLEPPTSALVLVDAQRLTCDPAHRVAGLVPDDPNFDGYYERAERALDKMAQLLALCRQHNIAVLHVRTAGNMSGGRDLSPKRRSQGVRISVDDPSAAIMPQVLPQPGEAVINKPSSSIFNGTGLDRLLVNMAVKTLIVAGASLDGTLESSLRGAGDRDYAVILVPEGCVAAASVEQQFVDAERGITNVRTVRELEEMLR